MTPAEEARLFSGPGGTINEAEWERLSEEAFARARAKQVEAEDRHAAFHKVDRLRYGRVERRRGYRGETRCLDCYYGKEWRG